MTVSIQAAEHLIEFADENGFDLMYDDEKDKLVVLEGVNDNAWTYGRDGSFGSAHVQSETARVTTAPSHANDVVRKSDLEDLDGSNVSVSDFEDHDHSGGHGENPNLNPDTVNVSDKLQIPEYATRSDSTQDSGLIYIADEDKLIFRS